MYAPIPLGYKRYLDKLTKTEKEIMITQYVYISEQGHILVLSGETKPTIRRRWPPEGGATYANYQRTPVEVPTHLTDAELMEAAQHIMVKKNTESSNLLSALPESTKPKVRESDRDIQTRQSEAPRVYDVDSHDRSARDRDSHDQERYDQKRYDTA